MPQLGQKRGCALRPCSSGRPLPAKRAATEQAVSLFGGVQNVKVPGGDRFSCGATLFRWACECTDKSVPFGKYCLSRPLVFSFDPRCHGLCGSQKYTSILVANRKATMIRKFLAPVPGQGLIQFLW